MRKTRILLVFATAIVVSLLSAHSALADYKLPDCGVIPPYTLPRETSRNWQGEKSACEGNNSDPFEAKRMGDILPRHLALTPADGQNEQTPGMVGTVCQNLVVALVGDQTNAVVENKLDSAMPRAARNSQDVATPVPASLQTQMPASQPADSAAYASQMSIVGTTNFSVAMLFLLIGLYLKTNRQAATLRRLEFTGQKWLAMQMYQQHHKGSESGRKRQALYWLSALVGSPVIGVSQVYPDFNAVELIVSKSTNGSGENSARTVLVTSTPKRHLLRQIKNASKTSKLTARVVPIVPRRANVFHKDISPDAVGFKNATLVGDVVGLDWGFPTRLWVWTPQKNTT